MTTTPADETIRKFNIPDGQYSATELTALQKNLDTKRFGIHSIFNNKGQSPYPGQTTFDRKFAVTSTPALTTQRLQLTRFTAERTESISSMKTIVHGTAAATITLIRYGIYSISDSTGDITLVASTTNDTALLAATNTAYSKALTTVYTVDGGRDYYAAVLVVATTQPVLAGITGIAADWAALPIPSYQVSSQSDLPATVVFASLVASTMLVYTEMV